MVTEDKDFGELVYRLKKPSKGIILIRMDVKERHMKWLRLKKLIKNYEERFRKTKKPFASSRLAVQLLSSHFPRFCAKKPSTFLLKG
jgi:predicted nuclease of predicted toxin-antitoxin system